MKYLLTPMVIGIIIVKVKISILKELKSLPFCVFVAKNYDR
jgi:hypothetical protein